MICSPSRLRHPGRLDADPLDGPHVVAGDDKVTDLEGTVEHDGHRAEDIAEDLRDTGRLLELYNQAVGLGLVTASKCDRLRFVAAAEHARVIGTRQPVPDLFVRLVRGGLWHFATHDDETAASMRLRQHLLWGLSSAAGGAGNRGCRQRR